MFLQRLEMFQVVLHLKHSNSGLQKSDLNKCGWLAREVLGNILSVLSALFFDVETTYQVQPPT